MNYATAIEKLTGRCQQSRKLQNNTYLQRRGQDIAVRLHSTDVVTFHPNGDVSLASGGWDTITTKDRIRSYSPFQLSTERGEAFLYLGRGQTVPFVDGITVTPEGEVKHAGKRTMDDIKTEWRETDRENARISRWKSKAKGLTRDSSNCRNRARPLASALEKCRCWQCSRKGFRPSGLKYGTCGACGCKGVYTPPACPKLTPAKIEAEENATVRRAMILCYGIARFLQDAGEPVETTALTPEFKTEDIRTFLLYRIDSYHSIAGMRDADGQITVVDGQCRNLADARKWFTKTAADCLVNRGQGSTEDIVRAELLRSL